MQLLKKQKKSKLKLSFGRQAEERWQRSGAALEGNILHASSAREAAASAQKCATITYYFQHNFAFTRMKFGHLEVQLLLDMGMLLYLTSNKKKKWALPYLASGYTILVLKQQHLNNFFVEFRKKDVTIQWY